jgi:hypothetical protein
MFIFIAHDAPPGAWRICFDTVYNHIVPTALGVTSEAAQDN